jgi:hypothetical protein
MISSNPPSRSSRIAMPRRLLALSALALSALPLWGAESARPVDYSREVQPILTRACVACHGTSKQRGGVRLDDGQLVLKGGNAGALVKPGKSGASRLVAVVAGLDPDVKMPPAPRPALTAAEVGVLRAWIDQGAKVPAAVQTTSATRSAHWAFQPIGRPPVPAGAGRHWVRNGIDAFVVARLEKERLAPAPEADRVTLFRRLHLDLIGLPPGPAEVDAYLADRSPTAYERAVDRLLASPAYGERWGRHWLDLARYADSDGYEKDTGRPFAWRYRHWVIEALNRDLGYDQFTIEQLAGDLLPGATTEQKVATGFHRNTLTNREGGVDQEQFRVEAVVDRVNTTTRVWLGLTLGCAQCHDHKYDPLSMRDYYGMFAFFNSDREANVPAPVAHLPDQAPGLTAAQARKLQTLENKAKAHRARQIPLKRQLWEQTLTPAQVQMLPADVQAILRVPAAQRSAQQVRALDDFVAKLDIALVAVEKQIAQLRKRLPAAVLAQTLALGPPRKTHILLKGDFLRPGAEVSAATPAVLPPARANGNRLDLARWLVAAENPLTARVAANWVWHKFFGRGLVPTLEDFGTQGEKPLHPELLDHLARALTERGWSLKALHRSIVTSAAYRQSSHVRPELAARDPYNVLLARQARLRLEAEVVRDVTLASSGLLVRRVGGPSVHPPQPAGVSELTYANSARWTESKGTDRYRRGLYTWFQRTSPFPMLMTFDAPDSNLCCVRRERSNTPLQALTLLNDATFVECARALGRRVVGEEPGDTAARLRHAFRLCVARAPTATELARLRKLFDDLHELAAGDARAAAQLAGSGWPAGVKSAEAAAWTALARALLNLDEVVTRE